MYEHTPRQKAALALLQEVVITAYLRETGWRPRPSDGSELVSLTCNEAFGTDHLVVVGETIIPIY